MKANPFYFFLFCLISTCPVLGQVSQRPLSEADYKLWSTMEVEQLSDAGNWASYSLHYESGNDTLFVKHTKNLKTYALAGGTNGRFAKERLFVCQGKEGQLILTKLTDGKQEVFENVSSYDISRDGSYLILLQKATNGKQDLTIKDLQGKHDEVLMDTNAYSYNAKANAVIFDSGEQLLLMSLDKPFIKNVIANVPGCTYSDFVWQKNGESVTYFTHDKVVGMALYKIKEGELYKFDPRQFASFPKDTEIYNDSSNALTISDDGSKVFFGVMPDEVADDANGVQVWNTADKSLYPERRKIKGYKATCKLAVWYPVKNSFRMLTDTVLPQIMLTGDQNHALLFNPKGNEPQFDYSAPIDFYLLNIETGEQELILRNQSYDLYKLSVSGTGRFVAYFKEKHWWVYDIVAHTHRNLTQKLDVSMEDENFDHSGPIDACGIGGWTLNDDAVLLYDNYDVWVVKTDGSSYKRLTDGRKDHIRYRLISESGQNDTFTNFSWSQKRNYSLAEGLLLQAKSYSKSGYFKWNNKNGLHPLVFNSNRVNSIRISKINDVCIYSEEHYHQPPKLIVQNKNDTRLLFQSNLQQQKYQWGFSKVITFENAKGEVLKGALFYPAGYTPDKSYPMVVHIYERQTELYNQYVNPTVLNNDGFNITNFTTKGYFVLLPDIDKEEGNTGRSALDCVTSAVNEVLAHEVVDSKRIGLLGHSFGGYQTNFIITQTNVFAAALSGAAVSDIISDYLYVAWNISKPNGWRYEYQQASMGVSLFDDYETYIKNSPITYAKQIQTPLLLWAGDNDRQIHYYQSLELHMALRRLQKPNILLLYEGDGHTLQRKEHKVDLTHRTQEWFDYYLKAVTKPDWFATDKL